MSIFEKLELEPSRIEPTVWVSQVVVYKSIRPPEIEVVREIKLDRGLNIIWAKDLPEESEAPIEVAGHSAGKTTFCRFLRYCLGEPTFATKNYRKLIRKAFPSGYVAAEVHVNSDLWSVARPIGNSPYSYAERGLTIEQLIDKQHGRGPYEAFKRELEEAVLSDMPTGAVIRSKEPILWDHILAWCTRDQETRFQDIWQWRSPRSDSESPALERPKTDGLFVMRTALGLFIDQELRLEEKLAELQQKKIRIEEQIEARKKEPEYWAKHFTKQIKILLEIPVETTLPLKPEGLFPDDLTSLVENKKRQLSKEISELTENLENIRNEFIEISTDIREKERFVTNLKVLFPPEDAALSELEEGVLDRTGARSKLKELGNKMCEYGRVLFSQCQHIEERRKQLSFGELQDVRAIEQAEAKRNQAKQQLDSQIKELQTQIGKMKSKQGPLLKQRDGLLDCRRKKIHLGNELDRVLGSLEQYIGILNNSKPDENLMKMNENLERTQKDIKGVQEQLAGLITEHEENRELLTKIFDATVRDVLADDYSGAVSLENRELSFQITHGPAMSGEAVETLAVLLSDISCLVFSMMGKGHLPGLLVHDSPREADLGIRIYHSFIRFMKRLHEHFDTPENCPFQYIVSTTTPPPREMLDKPFLKLHIDAIDEDKLLLKTNVANLAINGDKKPLFERPPTDPSITR